MDSENSESRFLKVEVALDQFETKLGIPATITQSNIGSILEMSREELSSLSGIDCGEYAFSLDQFAFQIQRAFNRERAKQTWCEEQIARVIAPIIQDMRGYSYDERRRQAVDQNEAAQQYDKLRVESKLKCERLDWLANRVSSMSKTLLSIQQKKGS